MMKFKGFSQIAAITLCLLSVIMLFSVTAAADTGPKPSVNITFDGLGDELCYGTLLSKEKSTGPASVWDGTESDAQHNENERFSYSVLDYDTWKAFAEYKDVDGYYFLQESWQVNETKELAWTYYPPQSFKILLYYPETGKFVTSGIYERYAFDTYYTVDMNGVDIGSVEYNEKSSTNERLDAYRSYNYTREIISLIARIIITLLIETAIALIFGFRKKRQLLMLLIVNAATQIILNVLLNVIIYNSGKLAFIIFYILFEIIVFVLEAIIYCNIMKKISYRPKSNLFYTVYALVANAISFCAGIIIADIMPGIF